MMKSSPTCPCGSSHHIHPLSRRNVLKMLGGSAAALLAQNTIGAAAMQPLDTSPAPMARIAHPSTQVAIAQATRYNQRLVREQVQALLDDLGGIADIVRPGDRVAIKVNLTGGTKARTLLGIPPIESFVTHPYVVRALGELLRDAGASRLYIVEGIFDRHTYSDWGYFDVAQAIDATLIDLNSPEPYTDFAHRPVGHRWTIYRNFTLNHLLEEVDTFISVAKMKCHWWAGITLTMKNLVGLVPVSAYNSSLEDLNRSAFHGDESITGRRLPQVIIDLNQARPIDLALIDGIQTIEGGEGPWHVTAQINSGVLIAGKNALATDAVGTAVMGFDPTAEMPNTPFVRGLNHMNLAYARGLGTNRLDEIEVLGTPIKDVQHSFRIQVSTETF